MAKLAIHPVGLVVIIFGMLVWIIALGGVGAATYSCQKANSYEYCAKAYQVRSGGMAVHLTIVRYVGFQPRQKLSDYEHGRGNCHSCIQYSEKAFHMSIRKAQSACRPYPAPVHVSKQTLSPRVGDPLTSSLACQITRLYVSKMACILLKLLI